MSEIYDHLSKTREIVNGAMDWKQRLAKIPYLVLILLLSIGIGTAFFVIDAKAQESAVPEWIKNVAHFWSNDEISDQEFVNSMEYLVDEGIMEIPSSAHIAQAEDITKSISEMEGRIDKLESERVSGMSESIPTVDESMLNDIPLDQPQSFSVICPYDKVRHFDTIHFRLWADMNHLDLYNKNFQYSDEITIVAPGIRLNSDKVYESTDVRRSDVLLTLESSYDKINDPILLRERIADFLNENSQSDRSLYSYQIEIVDVDHSVICANKPLQADISVAKEILR